MRLIQFVDDARTPRVGEVDASGATVKALAGTQTLYALAQEALASGQSLAACCRRCSTPIRRIAW